MIPDYSRFIYEINGQIVTDAKLAAYITVHSISGFSVNGNDVTLLNWEGRYLGASGGRGIGCTNGITLSSTNKRHMHGIWIDCLDEG